MSFNLSRRRTQSGANLATGFDFRGGGLQEEASIERGVHFLLDFVSLSIHPALSKCKSIDAANAI